MAPRMEILDSEDDGSDFSPIKEAFDGSPFHINGNALDAENPEQPRAEEPHEDNAATTTSSLKSTDPSFFQRVYEEQRAAAAAGNVSYLGPAPEADMSLSQPRSQPKGSSSLTSITDPGTASRKLTKSKDAQKKDVIDLTLTQVTTPRREIASKEVDPWDVPSSPETKSASHQLKTYGRRKRTNQQPKSSQPGQDPYVFPSMADPSPAQTTRKTRGMQSPLPTLGSDSSPVMLIPQTEENGSSQRRSSRKKRPSFRSMGSDSLIPDTGLYIAPSALTASQKQQYEVVALSSDPRQDTLEPALPVLSAGEQQLQKSSMATTIAYSTPSRFASSGKRTEIPSTADPDALPNMADPDALPSTAGHEVLPVQAPEHEPSSSPDVISEEPRTAKRGRPQEPPLETRSAKKRKSAEYQHTQLNIEDGTRTVLDDTPGRRRGSRRKAVQLKEDDELQPSPLDHTINDHQPDPSPQDDISTFDPNPDPDFSLAPTNDNEQLDGSTQAPKKKRGRKKKEPIPMDDADNSVQEDDPVVVSETAIVEDTEPPAKKRRGRPRKSTVPEPDPPVKFTNDADEATPAPPASTAKRVRRGRKKKEEAPKSAEHVQEEEEEQVGPEPEPVPALAELPQNSRPSSTPKLVINASDDDDDYDGDMKENEPAEKPATTPPRVETVEEKKEVKKAVPLSNQAAVPKVPYRVGLSKKSRIAPLLKSIRK
ncbi:hypothetical protein QBC34DRAFT_394926 [Podospora aff. communis PSN243]|uniref:AT hook domain-containing protein n=1 Tax=Podospora aff. communis PSN243 TaxID=3040156 RepID=A0AAV9H1D1_9PEZI|nr:hypothetical protein QBC34DRAFT_394926 [Podospora aff. communis PSN243]